MPRAAPDPVSLRAWRAFWPGALLLALAGVAGCDSSVQPVIGSAYAFTLWGYLDAGATQ